MNPTLPAQIQLMQMATASWLSQSVYVAAKLKIADFLIDGAKHFTQLAQLTNTHPGSLYRLLRALVSVGIFTETDTGYFQLTSVAYYLRSDIPDSLRAMAVMNGEEHYRAWGDLLYSVQTGECAFEKVYESKVFDYFTENPQSAQIFDEAMTSYSSMENPAIANAYDFSSMTTIVDVAGGHGSLIMHLLEKNPHLKGILFDLPSVIEGAKTAVANSQVKERMELVSGDFLTWIPEGGDAYLLKHIIHDWGDEQAIIILNCCRQAMFNNSKLLLLEMVIPPGNDPFIGKLLDLNMLVMCPGGCERTEEEYKILLGKAGFQLTKIIPTQAYAPVSIIEAISR